MAMRFPNNRLEITNLEKKTLI